MTVASRRPAARPADEAGGHEPASRAPLLALGVLTVVAFALRVVGMDQSLFNDERLTHDIVSTNGLGGVLEEVYETSVTPPLHYILAWLSIQFGGDDTILVRLPSLLFGTAMIPLLFVLGRRLGGVRVGLLAAAIMALSPFAIFYSTEARTYEVMVFLVTLSTLALLRAVEEGPGSRRWWIVYAASSCLTLWGHYTAVFVLAAQALWAFWAHRERWRELVLAQAAIAVGYVGWVPGYLEQRSNQGVDILDSFATRGWEVLQLPLQVVVGHPFRGLSGLPGNAGLLMLLIVGVLAFAAILYRPSALRRLAPSVRSEWVLVLILALATPVGLVLYDLVGPTLMGARNISASQPALILLVALALNALVSAVPARVAAVAVTLLLGVLAVVAIDSVRGDNRRPPYREVAHYLDDVAESEPVIELAALVGADARLGSTLEEYFRREHSLSDFLGSAAAWRRARTGGRVYVVEPRQAAVEKALGIDKFPPDLRARRARLGGPDGRAVPRGAKRFAGFYPLTVRWYEGAVDGSVQRAPGGQETISWTLGGGLTVTPGVTQGLVEKGGPGFPPFGRTLSGWAVDAASHRPAEWLLLFVRGRLAAVSAGGSPRPDVARINGPAALLSGFTLSSFDVRPDASSVRVFAVVGRRASELPVADAAKRAFSP